MATRRSTPAFAVGGVIPEFRCECCGVDIASMYPNEPRGLCCKHRDEHDFEYGYCIECGVEQEYDYDEGLGLGWELYDTVSSPEPLGIPAGALNGNAADRHNNPEAWANWVRFCEANGHG